jgi:hypothetical protein
MLDHLDRATIASADPPDGPLIETTQTLYTGRRGRPRIEIDRDILATSLEMRGPTPLAPIFDTSARTIRRRALEYGLVEPGHPVYIEHQTADGSTYHQYTSSTAAASDLTDDALDAIVGQIVETFPMFGRRMISGHLRHLGYRIPWPRLKESYI